MVAAAAELELTLTPRGHLLLTEGGQGAFEAAVAARVQNAFAEGAGEGLLQLGAGEVGTVLPPAFGFWRQFAGRLITGVCTSPEAVTPDASQGGEATGTIVPPPEPPADALDALVASAPPMPGGEYLTAAVLGQLWREMAAALARKLEAHRGSIARLLSSYGSSWHLVGRVHFHLAENRKDPDAPFAFLATYTTRLSEGGKPQHVPLGQALREFAGARARPQLLSLLLPVQRAAERCAWLKAMVDVEEIFHPIRWTPRDALALLRDIPILEQAGILVRVPAAWAGGRPARPRVTGTVGSAAPAGLGLHALLDFRMEVTLDGAPLTPAEVRELLGAVDGLALIRGRWVEVDPERLQRLMTEFERIERDAAAGELSFAEAMRLVAGADLEAAQKATDAEAPDWSRVVGGAWLAGALEGLRQPGKLSQIEAGSGLRGTLRPYQGVGVRWLHFLSSLGLGACLADDMGLGKTIQVLALLLLRRRDAADRTPSLLVVPASLIANWVAELERFAPALAVLVAHPSAVGADALRNLPADEVRRADLVITSYGALLRVPWLSAVRWDLVIADEAQAIKNPAARQTRSLKALQARARIALTGTPIENRVGDLWSIFDFLNPGLLGSAKQFTEFTKRLNGGPRGFAPLRELVRPYILRRMKTDRSVIADLPEKTEVNAFCLLTRKQAALYEQAVRELEKRIAATEGIERRGLVLATLMRLKQICNHPSHWLGDGAWAPADSGKWGRLAEIADEVGGRQEKMLVFTQFREVTAPLAAHLGAVFGRPGLALHGGIPVRQRRELVARFQEDERVPFFVLTVKTGGTGLNLTAASHVVHFDRWWNPAVEDQATDRAFRIGQRQNVLVHKFVCRGTVEERVDQLLASKRGLAKELLEGASELLLSEMPDAELLRLVALDVNAAVE